jgi:nicotinamide-nucleotide amidase
MNAEIITIGEELLIGQVIDTNSAWIAEQLNMAGIKVVQITSIADDHHAILKTLKEATGRAEIILMTGGLGPTRDDITKQALCEYFDSHLVFNQQAYENVERLFRMRGLPVTPLNRRQAEVPAACVPLPNPEGTAPGMWFERDGKYIVSMPGVPFEMRAMLINHVLPRFAKYTSAHFILHKTILTHGVGESLLAKKIEQWENDLPENIRLAYLPQPGIVRLRLTAIGNEKPLLEKQLNELDAKLNQIIPELVFGYDNDTMEEVVGRYLKNQGKTVATAESCTGGYIAHLITGVPGSSVYFKGSVVAYANELKENHLGVNPAAIAEHGAVSEVVVRQMADGVRLKMGTDYALAVSGIAGPDGGTEEKPVGTTWIALSSKEQTITQKFLFGEHRGRNIRKAALQALDMLRLELKLNA